MTREHTHVGDEFSLGDPLARYPRTVAKRERALEVIKLRLDEAATPDQVLATVAMLAGVLKASGASTSSPDFTIVVDNFDMRAELRAWNHDAAKHLNAIERVADNPLQAIQEKLPFAEDIAGEFAASVQKIGTKHSATMTSSGRKRWRRILDEKFVQIMKGAAEHEHSEIDRKSAFTTIETPVLQFGRGSETTEGAKALLVVEGVRRSVSVEPDQWQGFADAVASRDVSRVTLEAPVVRFAGGALSFDWKRATAREIVPMRPITGPQFLGEARGLSAESIATLLELLD